LKDWRDCFAPLEAAQAATGTDEEELRQRPQEAEVEASPHELGLGTRATNAPDRANALTGEDLLTVPMRRVLRLRGGGENNPPGRSPPRSRSCGTTWATRRTRTRPWCRRNPKNNRPAITRGSASICWPSG